MVTVITFGNSSKTLRLTQVEIDELFNFCFHVHDHDARTPPTPIYWERVTGQQMKWLN